MSRLVPFRERLKHRKKVILFVCTGNTCRSPMAAGYFRKLLDERSVKDIEIRSAGVMTVTGLLASQEAIQVMEHESVDLSQHRSTQLTTELIQRADLILAMTPFHRQATVRLCDDAKNKTFLLKEFTGSDLKNVQIADPMGCTLEVFKKCLKEIRLACEKLVEHEFIAGKNTRAGLAVALATTKSSSKKTRTQSAKPSSCAEVPHVNERTKKSRSTSTASTQTLTTATTKKESSKKSDAASKLSKAKTSSDKKTPPKVTQDSEKSQGNVKYKGSKSK